MKTRLIVVGKTTDRNFINSIEDYCSRVVHYMPFEVVVIPELKNTKSLTQQNQKELEGEQIIKRLQSTEFVVLLDEHGKEYRSIEFASWIDKLQRNGKNVAFVIGGPYGFSKAVYDRCDAKVSLSQMTFSHQMIRVLFVEQIYRACTILRGESYHHE